MASPEENRDFIKVSDLRVLFNAILDNIEGELKIKEVPLREDYYYYVSPEHKYKMNSDPESYSIGQLRDDWGFLKSVVESKETATPLNFMHLAPILEYLATQVDWYRLNGQSEA